MQSQVLWVAGRELPFWGLAGSSLRMSVGFYEPTSSCAHAECDSSASGEKGENVGAIPGVQMFSLPPLPRCLAGDGINRTCLLTVSVSFCAPGQQPIMMSRSGTVITAREGRGALCAGGTLALDGPRVGASLRLEFETQSGARRRGLCPTALAAKGRDLKGQGVRRSS